MCARVAGAGVYPPIIVNPSNVAVTGYLGSGYLAEVTPPTGKTAKELIDALSNGAALPNGAGNVLEITLNSAAADLKITSVTICVAAPGAGCDGSSGSGSGGSASCDVCCPVGTCDGPTDASKPECKACNACQTMGTPCPVLDSTKTVVLTLRASGSVSDYLDTSALQTSVAFTAGVHPSSVSISIAAGSVIITATIKVLDSSYADAVQTKLSSSLGTAAAASTALGITVEADPTIIKAALSRPPLPPVPPSSLRRRPPPPSPSPPPSKAEDNSVAIAVGAACGGLAFLLAVIAIIVFLVMRRSSTSSAVPKEVSVHTSPGPKKAAAPQSLSALLAACGLEHHAKTFQAEGYTLETLLTALKQGEAALKSDLRELKLTLGECRQLINQLGLLEASNERTNEYL